MRSIDIHAHLTPQCFWRSTDNGGDWHSITREQSVRGHELAVIAGSRSDLPPRARFTPEQRLADMDSLGVDIHVLSPYSGFYNYHLDTAIAVATSRDSNNEIHDMIQSWPERFAGLATLPMKTSMRRLRSWNDGERRLRARMRRDRHLCVDVAAH